MLGWIILFSFLGSVLSMAGGMLVLWQQDLAKRFSFFFISFAAGVLLGVAFFNLLPEALEGSVDVRTVSFFILSAIVVFFVVERFFWWYHHHRLDTEEHPEENPLHRAHAYILLSGDAIHNFVDGVVITAAFLTDFSLGVAVSLGVFAHEIPQEIADFSVMLSAGFSRMKVFVMNFAASLTTLLGAVLAFFAFSQAQGMTPYILAIAVGVFIYIALSDLIPSIHHQSEHKYDVLHFLFFIGGIVIIFFLQGINSGV